MPALVEILARHVPALILRRFADDPTPPGAPETTCFPAAVLFADITGFTALAERLAAERGPAGTEALTGLLNAYFEPLIARIEAHGGDIAKMAGDALIALWTTEDDPSEQALADATLRAAQCGLAVQAMPGDAVAGVEAAADVRLTLRIGVGAGNVAAMHVGGVNERWDLLLSGSPFAQMRLAQGQAQPGDVVLSPEAWALLGQVSAGRVNGVRLPGAGVRLKTVERSRPGRPARRPIPPPQAEPALWRYVPGAIRSRLQAGHTDWLAELRPVTVLFINLPDLGLPDTGRRPDPGALAHTQAAMQTLQSALYRYEGSINNLAADHTGITLLAAMGLPPLAHEDDAVRGVQAALEIGERLRESRVRSAIGIATGRAFCGTVGSMERRIEYTLIGDVVNLAARLMQAAAETGEPILCDPATREAAASGRLVFSALPAAITVKGKAEPLTVYRPHAQSFHAPAPPGPRPLFGRDAERALLAERLRAVLAGETDGPVVIEGEAGIGKSCLAADLRARGAAMGAACLVGAGDAIEKATPYHAWRHVFSHILNVEGVSEPWERRARVLDRLQIDLEAEAGWETALQLAPLLNDVLPALDLPENALTAPMSGTVRIDNTHELLLRLLHAFVLRSPTVLILEDAHWLDSASWALAVLVAGRVAAAAPLLLVLTTRPLSEPLPPDYRALLRVPGAERVSLGALPPENVLALVVRRLGITNADLPPSVAALILEKAQGNPFFSEELAHTLRDTDQIRVRDGRCVVAPGVDLRAAAFPDSVQGVITARIDRLTPSEQLTLKTASVIGRVFPFGTLRDIYPVEDDRAALADHLETLERLDITPLDTPEPNLCYLFKHVITQEVSYNLMLFAQRRQLHRAVALWYERVHADDLSPLYPLLAHHWSRAEENSRALDYLGRAGEQALRSGAYQEAATFFGEALALHARAAAAPSPAEQLREALWERRIGEAFLGAGQPQESRRHLKRAAALLGHAVPGPRSKILASVAWQILRQALCRAQARPRGLTQPAGRASPAGLTQPAGQGMARSQHKRDAAGEAARAYERLAEVHYMANEPDLLVHSLLQAGNLAEVAGPSPELARAYGNLCLAAGLIPVHRLAEAYARRAEATARDVGHPSALAWVLELIGIYTMGVGQWERAAGVLGEAIEINERLQDRSHREECRALLAEVRFHQGRFDRFAELYALVYAGARASGNAQAQAWGLVGQAQGALVRGRAAEAVNPLQEALDRTDEASSEDSDRSNRILVHGLLALAHLRLGAPECARPSAEAALALITQSPPSYVAALEGYAAAAEVTLALWEAGDASIQRPARRASRALCRFARVFPIGGPRACLWRGLAEWLSGRRTRAHRSWLRGLRAGQRLEMPYEQALAHYEIGRHLFQGDPARSEHLNRACEIFARLGADDHHACAQKALGSKEQC